jgi:hypothetical protein
MKEQKLPNKKDGREMTGTKKGGRRKNHAT